MTKHLAVGKNTIAYDVNGQGPLVVLAHGIGDSRHSYRFIVAPLVNAGYRVAAVDIRGCGESSLGWDGYTRTGIAEDLIALIHQLVGDDGGSAVIVGQSISGGAATIAAATAPELISGLIELAPFTRAQAYPPGGLLRVRRYRAGVLQLMKTMVAGSITAWKNYLDLAYPTKPDDWDHESARIEAKLREPGRMKALQAMCRANPRDAGKQLAHVGCPVLIVEGDLDPDWVDSRAEGERILAELPAGVGELVVLDGVGHYPHAQTPDRIVELVLPFLARTLTDA